MIVDIERGLVMGEGVNAANLNPTFHGEIAAINDYVARNSNTGWTKMALYTTGEPCVMCMGAIAWAGISQVIWASAIDVIQRAGIGQINVNATEIAAKASDVYQPNVLLGGVLAEITDNLFLNRPVEA